MSGKYHLSSLKRLIELNESGNPFSVEITVVSNGQEFEIGVVDKKQLDADEIDFRRITQGVAKTSLSWPSDQVKSEDGRFYLALRTDADGVECQVTLTYLQPPSPSQPSAVLAPQMGALGALGSPGAVPAAGVSITRAGARAPAPAKVEPNGTRRMVAVAIVLAIIGWFAWKHWDVLSKVLGSDKVDKPDAPLAPAPPLGAGAQPLSETLAMPKFTFARTPASERAAERTFERAPSERATSSRSKPIGSRLAELDI